MNNQKRKYTRVIYVDNATAEIYQPNEVVDLLYQELYSTSKVNGNNINVVKFINIYGRQQQLSLI